jgi:hypothetical protein
MSTTSTYSIPVPELELTAQEMVQRARDMVPTLRARQADAEELGRLPERTNGSAGMRGGAMWQRYQRDLTVLMTHNTVQPQLAADSYGRKHFGLLPHGVQEGSGPAPPVR